MLKQLKVKQIYLKDLSFQAPMGVAAFTEEWSPRVQVDVTVETQPIGDLFHEVELRLSVVSRTGTNTHFMVEVLQAGIFTLDGYDAAAASRTLRTECADILYPYAREAVDGMIARARLPALLLDPIDFAASHDGA